MNESIHGAKEELKRVDHIIYVSLKYTRTVDVIRNAILRMISAFTYLMDALLEQARDENKIESIPLSPRMKAKVLRENLYPEDKELRKFLDFYIFLRDLTKAKFQKKEEYRRHVAMLADFGNRSCEVDIDLLEDYFDKIAHSFFEYVKSKTQEEEE